METLDLTSWASAPVSFGSDFLVKQEPLEEVNFLSVNVKKEPVDEPMDFFSKGEEIDAMFASSHHNAPVQFGGGLAAAQDCSPQNQHGHHHHHHHPPFQSHISGQDTPFTWNPSASPTSPTSPNEYFSTLTCKSEYTPTFSQPTRFPPVFAKEGPPATTTSFKASSAPSSISTPFSYTADFKPPTLRYTHEHRRKESWEDSDDDDELLEGEDREAVKQRRKLRKMNREKQKRVYLNDKFDELCSMLSLGRNTRVEKLIILTETIKHLEDLSLQNRDLANDTQGLRAKIHAQQTGFPETPLNPPALSEGSPNGQCVSDTCVKLEEFDTTFCMDVNDLSLWDTGIEDCSAQLKDAKKQQLQLQLAVEDSMGLHKGEKLSLKQEEMFDSDLEVDAFFNVDDSFNPSDFSFGTAATPECM